MQDFSSHAGDFLFLHERESETNIALQDATGPIYAVPLVHGGIRLGFAVEAYREWQSKRVDILSEVGDMGAGHMFSARDPVGNYIQVYPLYPQVRDLQQPMG